MKATKNIFLRDLKSIVFSPFFVLLLALIGVLLSSSFIKTLINFSYASTSPGNLISYKPDIHQSVFVGHLSLTNMILIFLVPILTMRLIAGERKSRSFDLLMTLPINSVQISLGKFFAGFTSSLIVVLISILYPLATMTLIDFSITTLLSSYLGLVLLTAAYAAIGLFCSSLSSSIIFSVSAAFILNLMLWLLSQGSIFSDNEILLSVMQYLSVSDHLYSFIKGVLQLSSVIFFLSITCLFVFLSQRLIESFRWR